jgi:hypothetical protein
MQCQAHRGGESRACGGSTRTRSLDKTGAFGAPVRCGDTITGSVEVIAVRTDKPITELRTTVTRDDGTVVLDGTAVCYTMDIGSTTEQ